MERSVRGQHASRVRCGLKSKALPYGRREALLHGDHGHCHRCCICRVVIKKLWMGGASTGGNRQREPETSQPSVRQQLRSSLHCLPPSSDDVGQSVSAHSALRPTQQGSIGHPPADYRVHAATRRTKLLALNAACPYVQMNAVLFLHV